MSKHYANIPIGYVCVPVEEYADYISSNDHLFRLNEELKAKVGSLEERLETAEADRDSNKSSLHFWIDRARTFEQENEKLRKEVADLKDRVSFYQPRWEDNDQTT